MRSRLRTWLIHLRDDLFRLLNIGNTMEQESEPRASIYTESGDVALGDTQLNNTQQHKDLPGVSNNISDRLQTENGHVQSNRHTAVRYTSTESIVIDNWQRLDPESLEGNCMVRKYNHFQCSILLLRPSL